MSLFTVSLCLAPSYRCTDGRCIPSDNVCDGEFDCTDGGDEANCQCKSNTRCYQLSSILFVFED